MFYNDNEQTEAISEISKRSAFYELFEDSKQLYYFSGATTTIGFASTPKGKRVRSAEIRIDPSTLAERKQENTEKVEKMSSGRVVTETVFTSCLPATEGGYS